MVYWAIVSGGLSSYSTRASAIETWTFSIAQFRINFFKALHPSDIPGRCCFRAGQLPVFTERVYPRQGYGITFVKGLMMTRISCCIDTGESEAIRTMLGNPALREMVASINANADRYCVGGYTSSHGLIWDARRTCLGVRSRRFEIFPHDFFKCF